MNIVHVQLIYSLLIQNPFEPRDLRIEIQFEFLVNFAEYGIVHNFFETQNIFWNPIEIQKINFEIQLTLK